jgi:magnesium transporter
MESVKIYSEKIYTDIGEIASKIEGAIKCKDNENFNKIIGELNSSELTDILQTIDIDVFDDFVIKISSEISAYMLPALDEERTYKIFKIIGPYQFARIINNFDDHAFYDFLHHHQDLHEYENLFDFLNEEKQKLIKEFFSYPKDTAARLMQKNFVHVPGSWKVKQIKDYLRCLPDISEDINCILVTNDEKNVLGTLSWAFLLKMGPEILASEIMNKRFIVVEKDSSQKKVSQLFHRYSLSYALVADEDNSILGIITLNDITDAIEEQADLDIMHLQYVSGDPDSIEQKSLSKSLSSRLPWLFVNVIFAILVSSFISSNLGTLEKYIELAALIPFIASICSISGSQTIATTIHHIAKNEKLSGLNIFKFFTHEIVTAVFLSVTMAIISTVFVIFRFGSHISIVYFLTLFSAFIIASLSGVFVPLITHFAKFDPAVVSPIMVTSISDFCSYLLAFALVVLLLG